MGRVDTEVREELEELEEREEMEELEEREETVRRRWTVESSTVESDVPQCQPQGGAEPQTEPPQPPDSNAVSELVRLGVPSGLHPPPGSMPCTGLLGPDAMEQSNRNVIGMGRSRLCEYHLGMRSTMCNRGSNCEFAHLLSQQDVPNESPHDGRWLTVWSKGHVDICVSTTHTAPKTLRRCSRRPSSVRRATASKGFLIGHGLGRPQQHYPA